MTPKRVNDAGEAPCIVRWMVETPAGWLGAWDVEAFEAFAAAKVAAEREPLPVTDAVPHAIEVPGYGWVDIRAVRAVERAHGIGA